MKRFWHDVSVEPEGSGWGIRLNGRPLRTPARQPLIVPSEALAAALAAEWRDVDGEVEPRSMPLTGFANAAIDRVAPDRQGFAAGLSRYAEADLACYRAEGPKGLADRQAESWDAMLGWARRRYDADFTTTCGIAHVPQPEATVERLAHAVAMLDAFQLAGLAPLVTVGGSLVIALAVLEKAVTTHVAWQAVSIDERWQLEQWGADREAEVALEGRRREFLAAGRFLELVDS